MNYFRTVLRSIASMKALHEAEKLWDWFLSLQALPELLWASHLVCLSPRSPSAKWK